jgi:S-adenosylmethionine-dependent methyltransferase
MSDPQPEDAWSEFGKTYIDTHYGSLRGRVRTHVIHHHLLAHLEPAPLRIVDVGGGAGHQSIPLARDGYDVTIVDPSPFMLERAAQLIGLEAPEVATRVRLVEATGEDAPAALEGQRFGGVLCHGVVMYLDDPTALVNALCALVDDEGIVSIAAKNLDVMAVRPALVGDWAGALAGFDADRQINGLGAETRGDTVQDLSERLAANGVETLAWYGVRLFTDGWTRELPASDPEDLVLAVELEASRRDPYRQLSRLFHLVGRRQSQRPDGTSGAS